jgi:hypothetical protein
MLWACWSPSACRAVHFWLKSSLREHQIAFKLRNRKKEETKPNVIHHVAWDAGNAWISGILEFFEKVVSKALY